MFSGALWLAGFRPFFLLALAAGAILPVFWSLAFSGRIQLPPSSLPAINWHAHEMLYGFGWAVLGGFLLTASKNWVKIRGIHGWPLALLAALWIFERIAILHVLAVPAWIRPLVLNASVIGCAGYVLWSLLKYRAQDTFKDNYFFWVGLPLFLTAKTMMLFPETASSGATMTIGLFRLAFAVMLERTTTQFMKNAAGTVLPRYRALDLSIKFLVLASVFSPFVPGWPAAMLLVAAGTLMAIRYLTWHPLKGLSNFGIALMYVGHAGLITHLFLEGSLHIWGPTGVGTLSTHVFTFLCMGIIIPGMLIRISQGHTGRPLVFSATDRWAIAAMGLAALFRLAAPQIWPQFYLHWIALAAAGWSLCFVLIGSRISPYLWRPRLDGKVV
jgi:uncharacterized protein involved in response to NO